jgi:hypothetical protein
MGLLTNILLAPFLGPINGTKWTLDKVERAVREELTDDSSVKNDFMELQMKVELGEIDDEEYLRQEGEIMRRLREVREWREKFGIQSAGGPVQVAGSHDDEHAEERDEG